MLVRSSKPNLVDPGVSSCPCCFELLHDHRKASQQTESGGGRNFFIFDPTKIFTRILLTRRRGASREGDKIKCRQTQSTVSAWSSRLSFFSSPFYTVCSTVSCVSIYPVSWVIDWLGNMSINDSIPQTKIIHSWPQLPTLIQWRYDDWHIP